jgi:hypothetical protein
LLSRYSLPPKEDNLACPPLAEVAQSAGGGEPITFHLAPYSLLLVPFLFFIHHLDDFLSTFFLKMVQTGKLSLQFSKIMSL